jgi:hypothetical protein
LETDQSIGDSVWLRELRAAESASAGVLQKKEAGGAEDEDEESLFAFQRPIVVLPTTLVVVSLHYECVPHSTSVQVFAVVYNRSMKAVAFNTQLSAYTCGGDTQHLPCPLSTVSGKVDHLLPGQTACVSALVRVPTNEFVRCQREYVQFVVALAWREECCGGEVDEEGNKTITAEDAQRQAVGVRHCVEVTR